MNVGELRSLLAHLPDDLPVIIRNASYGREGLAARHVAGVKRAPGGTAMWRHGPVHQAAVKLMPGAAWLEPEPPVTVMGKFRQAETVALLVDAMNQRLSSET